jgi:hypothetical protein
VPVLWGTLPRANESHGAFRRAQRRLIRTDNLQRPVDVFIAYTHLSLNIVTSVHMLELAQKIGPYGRLIEVHRRLATAVDQFKLQKIGPCGRSVEVTEDWPLW